MSGLLRELLLSSWSMPSQDTQNRDGADTDQVLEVCEQRVGDVNASNGDNNSTDSAGGKSMAMVLPSLTTLREKLNLSNGLAHTESPSEERGSPATCSTTSSGGHMELPQTTGPRPPDPGQSEPPNQPHSGQPSPGCHYDRYHQPPDHAMDTASSPPDTGIRRSPKVKIFQKKVKIRTNVFEQMQAPGGLRTFSPEKSRPSGSTVVFQGSAARETVMGPVKTPRSPHRHRSSMENVQRSKKKHKSRRHSSAASTLPLPSSSASSSSASSASSSSMLPKLASTTFSLPAARSVFEAAAFAKPLRPPPAHSQTLPTTIDPSYMLTKCQRTHLHEVPRSREPISAMVPLDLSKVSMHDTTVNKSCDSRSEPQKDAVTTIDSGEAPLDLSVKKRPLSEDVGESDLGTKDDEPAQKKLAVEVVAVCGKMKFTRPVQPLEQTVVGKVKPGHVQTGITFGKPRAAPIGIATATSHSRYRLVDSSTLGRSETPRPAHLPQASGQGVNNPPARTDLLVPSKNPKVPSAHSSKQGSGRRSPILPSGVCSVNPSSLNAQSVVNVRGRSFKVSPVRPQVNGKPVMTSRTFPISNVPSSLSSSAPSLPLPPPSLASPASSSSARVNGTIMSGTIGCLQLNNTDGQSHRFTPPHTAESQQNMPSSSPEPTSRFEQVTILPKQGKTNLKLDAPVGMADLPQEAASPDQKGFIEPKDTAENTSLAPLLNIPTYKPSKPKSKVRKSSRPPLYVNIPERINATVTKARGSVSQSGGSERHPDPQCVSASTQTSSDVTESRRVVNASIKKSRFPHPQGPVMVARKSTTQVNKRLLQQYLESRSPPKLSVMGPGRSGAPAEPLTSPKNMPVLSPHSSPPTLLPQISPPSKNDKTLETATAGAGHPVVSHPVVKKRDTSDCDRESMNVKINNILLLSGGVAKSAKRTKHKGHESRRERNPVAQPLSSPPSSSILYSSQGECFGASSHPYMATQRNTTPNASATLCSSLTDTATCYRDLSVQDSDFGQDSPSRLSALSSTPLSRASTPCHSHASSPRSPSPCPKIADQERLLAKILVSSGGSTQSCDSPLPANVSQTDSQASSCVNSESEDDTPLSVIREHLTLKSETKTDSSGSEQRTNKMLSKASISKLKSTISCRERKDSSENAEFGQDSSLDKSPTQSVDTKNSVMLAYPEVSNLSAFVSTVEEDLSPLWRPTSVAGIHTTQSSPATASDIERTRYYHSNILRGSLNKSSSSPALNTLAGNFKAMNSPRLMAGSASNTPKYLSNVSEDQIGDSWQTEMISFKRDQLRIPPQLITLPKTASPALGKRLSSEGLYDFCPSLQYGKAKATMSGTAHTPVLTPIKNLLVPSKPQDFIRLATVDIKPHLSSRSARTVADLNRARELAEQQAEQEKKQLDIQKKEVEMEEVGTWTMVKDVSPRKPGSPAAARGKESSGTLVTVLRRDKSRDDSMTIARSPVDSKFEKSSPKETVRQCEFTKHASVKGTGSGSKDSVPPAKLTLKCEKGLPFVHISPLKKKLNKLSKQEKIRLKCTYTIKEDQNESVTSSETGDLTSHQPKLSPIRLVASPPRKKKSMKKAESLPSSSDCLPSTSKATSSFLPMSSPVLCPLPQPKEDPGESTIPADKLPKSPKKSKSKRVSIEVSSSVVKEADTPKIKSKSSSSSALESKDSITKPLRVRVSTPSKDSTTKPLPVKVSTPSKDSTTKPQPVKVSTPSKDSTTKPLPVKVSTPSKDSTTKPLPVKVSTPSKRTSTPRKNTRLKEESSISTPAKVTKTEAKVLNKPSEASTDERNTSKKKRRAKNPGKQQTKNKKLRTKEEKKSNKSGTRIPPEHTKQKRELPRPRRSLKSIRARKQAAKRKKEQEEEEERKRKRKRRSMLDELANSDGYVAEKRLEKKCMDLYADPSQLGREERALLRAMMQFSEMEQNPKGGARGNPKKQEQTSARKKAQALTKSALKRARNQRSPRKAKFDDFVPEILVTRTRTQTAELTGIQKGRPTALSYHKDNAYEKELRLEEDRRKYLRARRKARQAVTKVCRAKISAVQTSVRRSTSGVDGSSVGAAVTAGGSEPVIGVGVDGSPATGEYGTDDGCWEILATACQERRRRARNQATASLGGRLTLKLHWRPSRILKKAQNYVRNKRQNTAKTTARRRFFMGLRRRRKARKTAAATAGVGAKERTAGDEVGTEGDRGQSIDLMEPALAGGESTGQVEQLIQEGVVPEVRMSTGPPVGVDVPVEDPHPVPECVKKMSVNQNTGETILHKAARLGYEDVAKYCAETKYVDLDARDHAGYTAMHECCSQGHLAVASYLIGGGASVNLQSCDGMRPLHDAVENGLMEMVRLLLSCGADPRLATYGGKTVLGLTNVKEMTDFLNGYFQDLNGCKQHQPELAWQFQGTSAMEDVDEETGFDVLSAPVNDGDSQSAGPPDDPEFEFSDHPFPHTYFLALDPVKGACNYTLVEDLQATLGLTLEQLEIHHPNLEVLKVAVEDMKTNLQCLSPDVLHHLEETQDASRHVSLVEVTDKIRQLMDVTSERLSEMRAPGEVGADDVTDSYDWNEQYMRTTADYQISAEDTGAGQQGEPPTINQDDLYRALFAVYDDDPREGVEETAEGVNDGGVSEYSEGHSVHPHTDSHLVWADQGYQSPGSIDYTNRLPPSPDSGGPTGLVITEVCSLSRGNSPISDVQATPPSQHFS